jgi:hypothetical protein
MNEKALERQIHLGVCQLLKLNAAPGVVWFHCPNERRTTPREGAFLKRMGVLAGVADITILIPPSLAWNGPCVAFLELKRPGGRLSVAQEQFRDDVTAIGCLWALAYSTDQAAGFLREWGALRSSAAPDRSLRRAA